jgi:hypothetical protein
MIMEPQHLMAGSAQFPCAPRRWFRWPLTPEKRRGWEGLQRPVPDEVRGNQAVDRPSCSAEVLIGPSTIDPRDHRLCSQKMCGISGMAGAGAVQIELVHRLNLRQHHRGPDHEVVVTAGDWTLGNSRLAIQNPCPTGNQAGVVRRRPVLRGV